MTRTLRRLVGLPLIVIAALFAATTARQAETSVVRSPGSANSEVAPLDAGAPPEGLSEDAWGKILRQVRASQSDIGRSEAAPDESTPRQERNRDVGLDLAFDGACDSSQIAKPFASDAAAGDWFGWSVSVSGDTAVVGALFDDDAGANSGSAYVFGRNVGGADIWGQVTKLTASDAAAGDFFGWSVSVSGDTIVVGARNDDDAGSNSGSAYVFARNVGGADTWGQVAKLTASDAAAGDQFGNSVSVSGDTLVVGAFRPDGGFSPGSVYVFERRELDGAWDQVAKLTASDAAASDEFGAVVSVDGDTVVVGARNDDDAGSESGSAYVFERSEPGGGGADAWAQVAKLTASDARAGDEFGASVSVSGNTVVIGALHDDAPQSDSGSAYVFERRELDGRGSAAWSQVAKLTASDAAAHGFFGTSVSVRGDTVVVGAPGAADAGHNSGSAYVFERDVGGADAWGEIAELAASDAAFGDQFGVSVSVDGDTFIVGAYLDADAGLDSGSAYILALGCATCGDDVREAPEECDDGAANSDTIPDACRTDCTQPGCGDDITDSGESCDDGESNSDTASDACRTDCTFADCGDGVTDTGEECDDGNTDDGDGCNANCRNECGDGIQEDPEECDDGTANSDTLPDACRADCTLPGCGDDVTDSEEECDDGASNHDSAPDACRTDCMFAACGDGTTDTGEECDDGNTDAGDGCNATCRNECGDGMQGPLEECDDGAANSDTLPDACRTDCTLPGCGDVIVDSEEECDDGAANSDTARDACRTDCTFPACGDGVTDTGEDCDDGNTDAGDGCDATCQEECGNGIQEGLEECDDGSGNSETLPDACRTDCTLPGCGDDVTDSGEECDNGASNSDTAPDACRVDCTFAACGDGTTDTGEECDDNNTDDSDGCSATCQNECEFGGFEEWNPITKLVADDAASSAQFGTYASVDGDTLVVGRQNEAIYVFERREPDGGGVDEWGQVAKLTVPDGPSSVSVSGDTVVVGADEADDDGSNSGAAYVFERRELDGSGATAWVEVARLTASDGAHGDRFGGSVSVSGDTIVVGAHSDDDIRPDSGSAYVFERGEPGEGGTGAWGQVAKLRAFDAAPFDDFGNSVAVSGDTIVVGAQNNDDGAIYVFERGAGTWSRVTKPEITVGGDRSGYSVAISGDTIVAGTVGGVALVFERNEGGADAWGRVGRLTPTGAVEGDEYSDRFGQSVSVSGDTIVVGAYWDVERGVAAGAAYLFERRQPGEGGAGAWGQVAKLTAFDAAESAQFGYSVSASGGTVVVGARRDPGAGGFSGAAYVVEYGCITCGDDIREGLEACDDGAANSDTLPDACRTDCALPGCGDDVTDSEEECDDGASNSDTVPDACRTDCGLPACGDGVTDTGEVCDDGNTDDGDLCDATCESGCGDAILQAPEECDDGAANSDTLPDACRADCTLPGCGDDIIDSEEECDDGASNSDTATDACRADCSFAACGDGVIDTGEECDDGNTDDGDGCDATCQNECGDGVQEWNEIAKPDGFSGPVSISGDRVMVRDRVFERSEGGLDAWGLVAELDVPFTSVDSVSISGDVAVWGGDGRAFVFARRELDGGASADWGQIAELTRLDAGSGDQFGFSVGASGETIVVGAYWDDYGGSRTGSAYVFERGEPSGGSPGPWRQVAKLGASDRRSNDFFGFSVAISGDTIVVGRNPYFSGSTGPGSVYVFERNEGGPDRWGQVAKLIASDAVENDRFGASVSVSGDTLVVGRLIPGAAYVFERSESGGGAADAWVQVAKLEESGPASGDGFSQGFADSVAVSGDRILVGAYNEEEDGSPLPDTGAVYVYERIESGGGGAETWGQIIRLTASDPDWRSRFGSFVALDGDTVVVGDGAGSSSSAYILRPGCVTCGDDIQEAPEECDEGAANSDALPDACRSDCTLPACGDDITDSGEDCDDGASNSDTIPDACRTDCTFAACGDGIADTGEECDDGNTLDGDECSATCRTELCGDGNVNNGCETNEIAKLIASDAAADDFLGWSVAADGDTVVVGVPFDDDAGVGSGSVYVFRRDKGGVDAWGQVAKLAASDAAAGDHFGTSVSLSGKTIVVGAFGDDAGPDSGSAYVFERRVGGADAWEQVAKLTAADAAAQDEFGRSVSVSGNTVVVGALGDDAPQGDSGSAYVFERSEGAPDGWGQVAKLIASDAAENDEFGASVSVSGDTVVVGAPREDNYSGSAYVFERRELDGSGAGPWGQVAKLTASDTTAEFGASVSISGDTIVVGVPWDGSYPVAYVFERNASGADAWGEVTKLRSGCTVSVRGDVMVLADEYSAVVYQRNMGGADAWGRVGSLSTYYEEDALLKSVIGPRWPEERRTPPGVSQASGGNGIPIAVSGDTAILGSIGDDDAGSNAGSAHIFTLGCEGCDDGGINSDTRPDACRTDCTPPRCGDGVTDTGEGCDDGAANSDTLPGACRTDCTPASCGNGVIDSGEACDGGSSNSDSTPDACRTDCMIAACGDGVIDTGEECDDGNTDDGDGCNASCRNECGDGVVGESGPGARVEQCDDGNTTNGDGCNATCQDEFCGDGVVNDSGTEQCDDGNTDSGDGCNATCQDESCSDGIVNDACEGSQTAKLVAPDASFGDVFGGSVSVDGNTVVVGASRDDAAGNDSGSAYVFERRELSGGGSDAWEQVAKLTASDAIHGARFGDSVSVSRDTIVVGGQRESAYVFERRELGEGGGETWVQVARLTASDGAPNDLFGGSVAVTRDTIVVGARLDDDRGTHAGSVYVFERSDPGAGWAQVAKLTAIDAAPYDRFGASVSVSGDTMVVGARTDDIGYDSGAAYVFERREFGEGGVGTWVQVARLTAPDAESRDSFGDSVSVDDDTVVVGAHGDDDAGLISGSAYVFKRDEGGVDAWGLVAKLIASDGSRFDAFGNSVKVRGDIVVIGSLGDDDAGAESGSAYVFRRVNADDWVQVAKLTASDAAARDYFGVSASVDGDTVVVGAHQSYQGGGRPGSVYILTLECEECDDGNTIDGDGCNASCRNECGDGIVDDQGDCIPLVLDALWATSNADGTVTVGWRTALEVDMVGFHVLRTGDSRKDDELEELTLQPIPPRGSDSAGAGYTYTDTNPIVGSSHYYVVGIGRQGWVRRFGPVSVPSVREAPETRNNSNR